MQKLAKTYTKRFASKDQSDQLVATCTNLGNLVDEQATKSVDKINQTVEILNSMKSYVSTKRGNTKRHFDNTTKYQDVLHSTYDELLETNKLYLMNSKKTKDDKSKYDSALRNKNPLFRIGDPEERVAKLREKTRTSDRILNDTRNLYLIAIRGANAQQSLYYRSDLDKLIDKFDDGVYDLFKSSLRYVCIFKLT